MRIFLLLILSFIYSEKLYANGYSVSGYVRDRSTGEPLIGSNIFIEGTSIGAAADKNGFYEINNIKEGRYTFKASYIGYKAYSDSINLTTEKYKRTLDFSLSYTTIKGNEVIVTAQAKGQMDAINKQLNSKSLVNIISSDRIQELPDANAAETVARVPGVSIKREGGEGNKVIIRGLSPKYNNVTVNGVKLASTDNDDRSTDLSMISQYMLDGIEVTKAGTPDQDSDVLGGTVNFLLRKAEPGFHGNIITQGMHNGLENTYDDNKFVLDLSNRFFADRFGVLVQGDFENRNRSSHEVGASYNLVGEILDTINPLYLSNLNLNDWNRLNDRKNTLQVFDINILNGNISYSNLQSNIDKDIVRYNYDYDLSNNTRSTKSSYGLNNINILNESWKLTFPGRYFEFDAFHSFSSSFNQDNLYDFVFIERFAYDSTVYDQSISYVQKIAKNDTGKTLLQSYDFFRDKSDEKEKATGINLKYNLRLNDFITGNLKFGVKIRKKQRSVDKHHEYGYIFAETMQSFVLDSIIRTFNLDNELNNGNQTPPLTGFFDENYDGSQFFNGKYRFDAVADISDMKKLYDLLSENFNKETTPGNSQIDTDVLHNVHQTNSQMYDYRGDEEYSASYFMADFDISSQFNIVAGGRTETNKTTYYSMNSLDHALPHWIFAGDTTKHERKNSYFLPALFLNYKPTSWLNIKFAQTKTLTRPDYTSIIPLNRANGQSRTLDWRNKNLKPALSENLDFSLSFHENMLGLLSIGYFEKEIDGLIYSSGSRIFFEEDSNEFDFSNDYHQYRILNYELNNPQKVYLTGWELDYQTRLWYLPSFLSGLVFNINYTTTNSEVQYPRTVIETYFDFDSFEFVQNNIDSAYTDRLIDQTDEIINVSIGYDFKGFSGRLSMLQNDDAFLATNFWPALRQHTDAYRRWDLSLKQTLPVDGLEIFLNASNLTETNDVTRYRGLSLKGDDLKLEQYYGKTIDFGFRYSF